MPLRPRPDPARAVRILVWGAALILLGQLAVGFALDRAPMWVRFPQGEKAVSAAARQGERPFVAIFGSSRFRNLDVPAMATALDEDLGGTAPVLVQAAVMAGDPVAARFLFDGMRERGARPALVVLELSPETLSAPAHWIGDHVTRFFTAGDVVEHLGEIRARGQLEATLAKRINTTSFYRFELLRWITEERPPYLRVPPAPEARPAAGRTVPSLRLVSSGAAMDAKTSSGLRRVRKWLADYEIGGVASEALEALIQRCASEDIPLVLVGVPVGSWQRELYEGAVEERFQAFLGPLLERSGVAFVDHRARVPDDLFEDNHHLSPEGGRYYGEILAREVIAPRDVGAGREVVLARRP